MIINSRHSFYNSQVWSNCKQQVYENKKDENGIVYCEMCGKPLIKSFDPRKNDNRSSIIYHHTIELTEQNYVDYNISANPSLIQILCFKCHNAVHNRFGGGTPRKKVYIVYGPSCSGKTTWVKEQLGENDLVADIDDLWEYVSKKPRYIKPNTYKDLVFALWNEYLEQIKMRTGFWNNAYIITGEPLSSSRRTMADKYNAELIHIDTPKEKCLENLYNNPQGRDIKTYEGFITKYFDRFTE